jgi:hypothetical protein
MKIAARRGNSEFIRPVWAELGISWVPADRRSEKQYEMWTLASGLDSKSLEIPGDMESQTKEMVACTAVYHSPKMGMVERSNSYVTRNGNVVCLGCKAQREGYNKAHAEKAAEEKRQRELAGPPVFKPAVFKPEDRPIIAELIATPNGLESVDQLPLWHVTVIQPTIVTVRAKDFLDAASQVSDRGEIIKVERV